MAYQTFATPAVRPTDIHARVAALRARFDSLGVDGVVVPHENAYQSEYLPASEERLHQMTGFSGSAGRAVILRDSALFETDGRYALQAKAQVPGDLFTIVSTADDARTFLKEHLDGLRLGYDPSLHARASVERLSATVETVTLVPLSPHPMDGLWLDRPASICAPVRAHPPHLAGRSTAQKLDDIRAAMGHDALLIAAADTVTWLFNWRGGDVAHTPLVLARAFVPKDGPVTLFLDESKLDDMLRSGISGIATLAPAADYPAALTELSDGLTVEADPQGTSEAALAAIEAGGTLVASPDPAARLKAIKNPAEVAGMRDAHQRDGVAMAHFLAWFDEHAVGKTEIDCVKSLEAFRRDVGARDISFDTIAGAGPNGAIIHYRVDEASNRVIAEGDVVLIDSGGQYDDGTTDITRTLVAGTPSDAFRINFTRVLKGHIALARQRFPVGATGAELDTLARAALWNAGFDYAHGTGHGVGAALAVHEAPPGISKKGRAPIEPGMIVSNEPGDYHEGAYGIRIENLVLVLEPAVPPGGLKPMLSFETLTLAPIDTRLVAPHILSPAEIGWLDAYHVRVLGALSGDVAPEARAWLTARCKPIADIAG
ncbi:MAG: aminopeptidase P family protein [Pseudomonadota bacterium]